MTINREARFGLTVFLCFAVLLAGTSLLWAATARGGTDAKSTPGLEAARTITTVTGVAISPLLGAGAVGAYQYWRAAPGKRASLPWFAQCWFWIPSLLLAAFVGVKDILGTAAPTALKKPFDVAEAIENKISGLIMAGAFIPLIISIFPHAAGDGSQALASSGFAAISAGAIGNALLVPFALAAYAVVWMASHTINVLIVISPFTTIDSALKSVRIGLLSLVTATAFADPYVAAGFSILLIVLSYFIAGWSFRLTFFGTVCIWDFVTRRSKRFQPGTERNFMFTARKLDEVPVRTYGVLHHRPGGELEFSYRRWLFWGDGKVILPAGEYCVGRGLLYPEIIREQPDRIVSMLLLPPRFNGHEDAVARAYGFAGVRDVGLLKGMKAAWAWLKSFFRSGADTTRQAETVVA
jgi:hypothetical protein